MNEYTDIVEVLGSSQELKIERWKRLTDENNKCDSEILNGMSWGGHQVYLSRENQFNYKALYDLAVQGAPVMPAVFRIGYDFHEFTTIKELSEFYIASVEHVNSCLHKCWQAKEAINAEMQPLIDEALEREAESSDGEMEAQPDGSR